MIKEDGLNRFMRYPDERAITLRIPQHGWMLEISQPRTRGAIPTTVLCYQCEQQMDNPPFIAVTIPNQLKLYEFLQDREQTIDFIDSHNGFVRFHWGDDEEYFTITAHVVNCHPIPFLISKNWFC